MMLCHISLLMLPMLLFHTTWCSWVTLHCCAILRKTLLAISLDLLPRGSRFRGVHHHSGGAGEMLRCPALTQGSEGRVYLALRCGPQPTALWRCADCRILLDVPSERQVAMDLVYALCPRLLVGGGPPHRHASNEDAGSAAQGGVRARAAVLPPRGAGATEGHVHVLHYPQVTWFAAPAAAAPCELLLPPSPSTCSC